MEDWLKPSTKTILRTHDGTVMINLGMENGNDKYSKVYETATKYANYVENTTEAFTPYTAKDELKNVSKNKQKINEVLANNFAYKKRALEKRKQLKSNTIILDLDDDCLLNIFSYLTRHKKFHMAMACGRFFKIFCMCTKFEYKNIKMEMFENFSECELHDYFKIFSSYMKTWSGPVRLQHIDTLFAMRNQILNIQNIDVLCFSGSTKYVVELMKDQNLKQTLKVLKIDSAVLDDEDMFVISELPNLKVLHVYNNEVITGEHIMRLTQLSKIALVACTNIDYVYWVRACESLTKVKALDVRRCPTIIKYGYKQMFHLLQNLVVLRIDCNDAEDGSHFQYLTNLPHLKKLELVNATSREKELMKLLSRKHDSNLTILIINNTEIYRKKDEIDFEFMYVIMRMLNLRQLMLFGCPKITDYCLMQLGTVRFMNSMGIFNCRLIVENDLFCFIQNMNENREIVSVHKKK